MTLLLPMTGFCISYKSTSDTLPQKQIMKALIKCDSINTLLSKNLMLAETKDSVMTLTLMHLRKVSLQKDSTLLAEKRAFKKEKRKSNRKTVAITVPAAILTFQIIKTLLL